MFIALPCPFTQQLAQVGLAHPCPLGDLHYDPPFFQCKFVTLVNAVLLVSITHEVPIFVVDHDSVIECMEAQAPILPALGLASDIVRE